MKFSVDRDALAEAAAWVARALPSRPVIPVLAGLLLRAEPPSAGAPGGLTLSCFDYEVSARMRIPAEVSEPGTILVPGRLLVEITRSLPPGRPVDFGPDPEGMSMTCGEAAFIVATLPAEEYPDLPDLPQLAGTADGGVLAAAIGQITPAASRDDTLPMLTAVSLELAGDRMTLAATDRYRLAVRDLEWEPAPDTAPVSALVPARVMADAARMMSGGEPARIFLRRGDDGDDGTIGFEAGERRLTTRLLAGEFIRYRSRFPSEFGCEAEFPAGAFSEAVRRVGLVAERGTPVRLSFGPGRVTIVAATQGQARARESVPADFTGDEPDIAFNPGYLLDGVTAAAGSDADLPAGARVRLSFSTASKPAVITQAVADDAGQFRYLVVPQRAVLPKGGVPPPFRIPLRGAYAAPLTPPAATTGRKRRRPRRAPSAPLMAGGPGAADVGVGAVPGEQVGGEQPDQHGQDQQ